jgi:ligand-binding sensor domain-containing protein
MMPDADTSVHKMPNFLVWDIMIDKNDLVWIASDVHEFSSYDSRTDKFTYYDWPRFARSNPTIKQYKYKSIQKISAKSDHEFWLGTTTGLVLLNTDTKQFRFIASGGYYAYVLEIVYDPENKKYLFLPKQANCLLMMKQKINTAKFLKMKPNTRPPVFYSQKKMKYGCLLKKG